MSVPPMLVSAAAPSLPGESRVPVVRRVRRLGAALLWRVLFDAHVRPLPRPGRRPAPQEDLRGRLE